MRTTADTSRDQAERYLFTALPLLPRAERRALALAELVDDNRMAIASDVGLAGDELSAALARARKALRRTQRALPAGGRCERTERLVSDALDGDLPEGARLRRDAHLERCPRCREHVALLDAARAALRTGFEASLTVTPQPLAAAPPPPAPVAEPPAPREPQPAAAPPEPRDIPVTTRPERHEVRRAPAVLLALLLLIAAIAGGVAAVTSSDDAGRDRAPWAAPSAPDVRPAPLAGQ